MKNLFIKHKILYCFNSKGEDSAIKDHYFFTPELNSP